MDAKDISFHPCYTGWFEHFNAGEYYTAHDVLEHLWLQCSDENYAFFKGMIQVAGAFVHFRKQFERPYHPKDGKRLYPAVRLLKLALQNLESFDPVHLRLDVASLRELCVNYIEQTLRHQYRQNPWSPDKIPCITLLPPQAV